MKLSTCIDRLKRLAHSGTLCLVKGAHRMLAVCHRVITLLLAILPKRLILKRLIVAWSIAVGVLLFIYGMSLVHLSLGSEVDKFTWVHNVETFLFGEPKVDTDSLLFVNINYDKVLVPVSDELGMPAGHTDITDRSKLLQLLRAAERVKTYKYILLDVFFEKGLQADYDSLLFQQIARMPRIVIPKHQHATLADSVLLSKAAYADYFTDKDEHSFVKYPLFIDGEPTLATTMYASCTHAQLEPHGLYATENGRPMRKTMIPVLPLGNIPDYDSELNKLVYNLTEDLLVQDEYGMLDSLLAHKYIIIGGYREGDIHATFKGNVPGCIIHFDTYLSMLQGKHRIAPWVVVFLMLVFTIIGYTCVTGTNLWNPHNRWLSVGVSWVSYSIVLTLISCISYYAFHVAFDVLITTTLFEVAKRIIAFTKLKKQTK